MQLLDALHEKSEFKDLNIDSFPQRKTSKSNNRKFKILDINNDFDIVLKDSDEYIHIFEADDDDDDE